MTDLALKLGQAKQWQSIDHTASAYVFQQFFWQPEHSSNEARLEATYRQKQYGTYMLATLRYRVLANNNTECRCLDKVKYGRDRSQSHQKEEWSFSLANEIADSTHVKGIMLRQSSRYFFLIV